MAERRMFAKTIIDSDAFLEMPLTTQVLYFHLSMRADDEGFINNPKKIMRMIGVSDDDLKLLIAKSFIIPFDSGIVVIKHWRIHNYLRNDRFKPTVFTDEMSQLVVNENKSYSKLKITDISGIPDGIPMVYQMDTQDSIGKDRIGKVSIGEDNKKEEDTRAKEIKKIVEAYENSIGMMPQHVLSAALSFLDGGMESDLIARAIQIAAENNVRKWNYAAAILRDCQNKGIKTLSAFEAEKKEDALGKPKEKKEDFKGQIYAPPPKPVLIDPNKPFDINDYLPGD